MSPSPESKRILLLDRDLQMRRKVEHRLGRIGFQIISGDPGFRLDRASGRDVDLVLLALGGSEATRREIDRIRRNLPEIPIVLLSDPGRVEEAVTLLRAGADDYLLRPPDAAELRARLQRIVERHDLDSRIAFFQSQLAKKTGMDRLVTRSRSMRAVAEQLQRVAPRRATVLVYGESGVGKELVARAIHFNSSRRDHPFIALNCAAIPATLIESELFGHERGAFTDAVARTRGKFEIAHRGTLFLDEIGEMDPSTQVKLLRVLEEREFMRIGGDRTIRVDVRVLAATNADLEQLVADKRFREDLYYRLKVVTLNVPPLRERVADIPDLVSKFLEHLARENAIEAKTMTPETLQALQNYAWPGNVRELKNVLESMLVSVPGKVIELEHLPASMHRGPATSRHVDLRPGVSLAQMEKELIRLTLEHTGGNRTHGATLLGIGVRTLQRKITTYGLDIPPRRRRPRDRSEPES